MTNRDVLYEIISFILTALAFIIGLPFIICLVMAVFMFFSRAFGLII